MNNNSLLTIKDMTLNEVIQILQIYDNKEFSDVPYKGCNCLVPTDFLGKRIKNGEYSNCTFNGNNFQFTGAAGTRFLGCKFIACNINGSNMQFCDFSNSIFSNNTKETHIIEGTNFNQSCFYKSIFQNVCLQNVSICQSQFLGTQIENSDFRHATLQDNIFRDVYIVHSTFIGCNLEYSDFMNVTICDSILPFHQIPYIYGGLQCLVQPENTIKIVSSMENADELSADAYLKLLPVFTKYYENERDYFPLANIALFLKEYPTAKKYIRSGLKEYILKREFRKLKTLCKLAVKNGNFNRNDLSDFYFDILAHFNSVELSPNEQYQFGLHIDEIKNILFGLSFMESSYIEIVLKTNLTINDGEELIKVISIIEDCLNCYDIDDENYNLELKHNSPSYSLWVIISSMDPNMLAMALGMLQSVFSGNMDSIYQALDACANLTSIMTFVDSLRKGKAGETFIDNKSNLLANKEAAYALSKHKLLKKKTEIKFSIGNTHFNYKTEKSYQ